MLPPTLSFLPVSTLHITYTDIFKKSSMPFDPKSKVAKVAWMKKECTKATKAPVMANFEVLKHEV